MITKKQLKNSIWGFILGDCWGVPYEFKDSSSIHFKEFAEYGTHRQPAGTWSDDTSLMLCLIDSYNNGVFDKNKHKQNLRGFAKGKFTPDNIVFDIGNSTREAIYQDFNRNNSNALGNGGLLRCWLLGVIYPDNEELLKDFVKLTHSINEVSLTTFKYYYILYNLCASNLDLQSVKQQFPKQEFDSFINDNKRLSGFGTIVNAVDTAVNSFYKDYTLKEVIETGGDTDSNAAVYGSLYYLRNEISMQDKTKIRKYEYLEKLINDFFNKIYGG